jgi:uncharacterized protein
MNRIVSRCAVGAVLLAAATTITLAHAEERLPGFGFAQRCDGQASALTPLERIACGDPKLRAQEKTMLDLVAAAREETTGMDGDTGARIDPLGKEQYQWRKALEHKCSDAQCLSKAYTARIAQIHKDWADALNE